MKGKRIIVTTRELAADVHNQLEELELEEDINFEDMKENIFIKTRQFAKRQNQWFNKENVELFIKMDTLKMNETIQILCGFFRAMI